MVYELCMAAVVHAVSHNLHPQSHPRHDQLSYGFFASRAVCKTAPPFLKPAHLRSYRIIQDESIGQGMLYLRRITGEETITKEKTGCTKGLYSLIG